MPESINEEITMLLARMDAVAAKKLPAFHQLPVIIQGNN